jgi:membrane-bound transcription factor site-1 protease
MSSRARLTYSTFPSQVLIEAAHQITTGPNVYEQGFGKLDLLESFNLLTKYQPRASFAPSSLDLTECPYMWPYCAQPLYYSALPVIFNVTILNGMGVTGTIDVEPVWVPVENGDMLDVGFTFSKTLWPWSGWVALHFSVAQKAARASVFVQGIVRMTVRSPPALNEDAPRATVLELPVKVKIIPTPARAKRVLWDQYHNLRYPSGYFPRDALWIKQEPFDWNGDHPYTNFRDMFNFLRENGFFLEILGAPYTCFNASNYGTLLVVDPEDEFFPAEIEKLKRDVEVYGLSVAVFADWYDVNVIKKIKFFDENTKQWWTPVTGFVAVLQLVVADDDVITHV